MVCAASGVCKVAKTKCPVSAAVKVVEIGNWDMDADISVNVAHDFGIKWTTIRAVTVCIRNDTGGTDKFILPQNL